MSTTHDELAYAVAMEAVAAIRARHAPWDSILSGDCHVTSSRRWPVPDFVIDDHANQISVGAEFKPPGQTKREYLTGLGQALAYTKDFDYSLLVVPQFSDDRFPIAAHILGVLTQGDFVGAPIGLLSYDPAEITADRAGAQVLHFFRARAHAPIKKAKLDESFYAKWREISGEEIARFLRYLYREQTEPTSAEGNFRDRAWKAVWADIQAGKLHNWTGLTRTFTDNRKNYTGNMKNWRNFMNHIGWIDTDGSLTEDGLRAHHKALIYDGKSQMFRNLVARAVLLAGKHLILINAINEYQRELLGSAQPFPKQADWLDGIEDHLEKKGLLLRNPERHSAATEGEERQFLKAEKQLWKELGFIIPLVAGRVRFAFHPGQGFVFDWARITDLVRS